MFRYSVNFSTFAPIILAPWAASQPSIVEDKKDDHQAQGVVSQLKDRGPIHVNHKWSMQRPLS